MGKVADPGICYGCGKDSPDRVEMVWNASAYYYCGPCHSTGNFTHLGTKTGRFKASKPNPSTVPKPKAVPDGIIITKYNIQQLGTGTPNYVNLDLELLVPVAMAKDVFEKILKVNNGGRLTFEDLLKICGKDEL